MLRWLTRLFGQRDEAETASAAPPPLETPQTAAAEPTPSDAAAEPMPSDAAAEPMPSDAVAVVEPVEAEPVEAEPVEAEPIEALTLVELPETTAEADAKETCPTCGKIGVFAGPPGQRFCTYCALRDELFERSVAATE